MPAGEKTKELWKDPRYRADMIAIHKKYKPTKEARRKQSLAQIGRKLSIETKIKLSKAHKMLAKEGKNHWGDGTKCSKNRAIRNSFEYRLWRTSVYERDNYTCIWCGERGGKLNADHIKPFSLYPELRFAIDNGRTLCVSCHKTTDTWGGKSKNKKIINK